MARLRFDKRGNITLHQKTHNHKPNRNQYVTSQRLDPDTIINPIDNKKRAEEKKKNDPTPVVKGNLLF